ncbi:hypothetical protein, partial [Campylobacter sp.]|uniref:hypothetical protein n=1 Tax=Campylobacter sp. TaxID=205 RepID=UPI0025B9E3AD
DVLLLTLKRTLTFYRDRSDAIRVSIGCRNGMTILEFKNRIYAGGKYTKKNLPEHRKDYLLAIKFAKKYFKID